MTARALEKANKFITPPYLHITPQGPVNKDSEETSRPHPLPPEPIRESPGVNVPFTNTHSATPDLTSLGSAKLLPLHYTTVVFLFWEFEFTNVAK